LTTRHFFILSYDKFKSLFILQRNNLLQLTETSFNFSDDEGRSLFIWRE